LRLVVAKSVDEARQALSSGPASIMNMTFMESDKTQDLVQSKSNSILLEKRFKRCMQRLRDGDNIQVIMKLQGNPFYVEKYGD
jgi:hypothetical protein